jgi:hypothetical protein
MPQPFPESPHNPEEVIRTGSTYAQTATRFLFGGYVALAMATVVLSWHVAPAALVEVAIVIIILTTIIALLTRALSKSGDLPSRVFLWSILVTAIFLTGTFLSAAFLGFPERGAVIAARFLQLSSLALVGQNRVPLEIGPGSKDLPAEMTAPPDVTGDRYDRIAALSKRQPITIKGAWVPVSSPTLYVNVLRLEDGGLVTNGRDLTIEAVRVESVGDAGLRAFAANAPLGASGGTITLIVYDGINGQLSVDLSGSVGAPGAAGRPGVNGPAGRAGENSSQTLFGCSHGGGAGERGGPGGRGEDGGAGNAGGNGGTFILQVTDPDEAGRRINFVARGGRGGDGGPGGTGGLGGPGGPGGHGGGFCGGGQAGPGGAPGEPGRSGPQGMPGKEGTLTKIGFGVGGKP